MWLRDHEPEILERKWGCLRIAQLASQDLGTEFTEYHIYRTGNYCGVKVPARRWKPKTSHKSTHKGTNKQNKAQPRHINRSLASAIVKLYDELGVFVDPVVMNIAKGRAANFGIEKRKTANEQFVIESVLSSMRKSGLLDDHGPNPRDHWAFKGLVYAKLDGEKISVRNWQRINNLKTSDQAERELGELVALQLCNWEYHQDGKGRPSKTVKLLF